MDWMYFSIKVNESMYLFDENGTMYLFDENEKQVVNNYLFYLNKVDDLRARLMFFIIWDIEYFYNRNTKDYEWNTWVVQYQSMLEVLIFQMDECNSYRSICLIQNTNLFNEYIDKEKELKMYDPEENIEFLNRLFNVIGIADVVYNDKVINDDRIIIDDEKYFVSSKFNNYNEKYVEVKKIMYKHDFKRWEENLCNCNYLSSYEIEISYKTEDYIQKLRKEWEESLNVEKLEERNWRLLIELEELMDKK